MRKILFAILCLLFVSCSNLYKANKAYERGDYVENVVLTFKYFDEKPENFKELNEKKKNEINSKFSNIFEYYSKQKNSEKLEDINKANIELFTIYIASDNSQYAKEFQAEREFLASNNVKTLFNQALKTNKELFSQNIGLRDDHTYALKVIDHTINMNIAIDAVVESNKSLDRNKVELYNYFKKEIAKHRADGYISLAEVEEKEGSNRYLRSAQNLYYKANEIYSKYQKNYRNSYSKYESAKYKADLNDAEDNYNKGITEYRNAGSSKAKYRAANYYFKEAQKYVYNYKDTNKLLNETKEKGYFKYSLNSNTGKPIMKVYNFTKITTTIEEIGTIRYTFSVRGAYYNNNISNDITIKNTVNNVKYSGEVPPSSEYRNSDNKALGSNELKKKVEEKLKKEVNGHIDSMIKDLKRI